MFPVVREPVWLLVRVVLCGGRACVPLCAGKIYSGQDQPAFLCTGLPSQYRVVKSDPSVVRAGTVFFVGFCFCSRRELFSLVPPRNPPGCSLLLVTRPLCALLTQTVFPTSSP